MRTVVNPSNDCPYIMCGLLERPTTANRPIQIFKPSPLERIRLSVDRGTDEPTPRLSILRLDVFARPIFDGSCLHRRYLRTLRAATLTSGFLAHFGAVRQFIGQEFRMGSIWDLYSPAVDLADELVYRSGM